MEKAKQKQEAIERMKLLKLHDNVIREFDKEGIVNMSENGGFLYWLNSDQQEIVDEFEAEHNALVYHVIRSLSPFGTMYALLYVSQDEDEWDYDKDDIKSCCPLVYVKNIDDDICSEFGSIGIKPQFGGLVRTA